MGDDFIEFEYDEDVATKFTEWAMVDTVNFDETMYAKEEYVRKVRNASQPLQPATPPAQSRVLDVDPLCSSLGADFVFTDTSEGSNRANRRVFIRERNGTLRTVSHTHSPLHVAPCVPPPPNVWQKQRHTGGGNTWRRRHGGGVDAVRDLNDDNTELVRTFVWNQEFLFLGSSDKSPLPRWPRWHQARHRSRAHARTRTHAHTHTRACGSVGARGGASGVPADLLG